jgi:hypothetical protein
LRFALGMRNSRAHVLGKGVDGGGELALVFETNAPVVLFPLRFAFAMSSVDSHSRFFVRASERKGLGDISGAGARCMH